MAKIGRNSPCPCGSGKKYKKCCITSVLEGIRKSLPQAPNITPMSPEELQNKIGALSTELSKYTLSSILGSCFLSILKIDWNKKETGGMTSPYKQCAYIASLAAKIPASEKPRDIEKNEWQGICALSEEIFSYYAINYFDPKYNGEERYQPVKTAMLAFLANLGTGLGITVEQTKKDIEELHLSFDNTIEKNVGLSVKKLLEIADYTTQVLQSRIDEGPVKLMGAWLKFREDCDAGVSPFEALSKARSLLSSQNAKQYMLMGSILLEELYSKFERQEVDNYLGFLSQERSTAPLKETFYPTEEYCIETHPLVREGDKYLLINANILFTAILRRLETLVVADENIRGRYYSHKASRLEKKTLLYLKTLLDTNTAYYEQLCERPDAQNEHDIIIVTNKTLLIVECKAKRIRKDFRDPDKAYTRIKDDFNVYIQEGYNQAVRLKNLILSQTETILYNLKGEPTLALQKNDIDRIECLCVTENNEGALATDLSLLLSKNKGDDYPYCINRHDLRHLAELKDFLEITTDKFLQYIAERKKLYGKVMSDDELDFWGYFLKHASFKKLIEERADLITIEPAYSGIFDEAYKEGKYAPVD